MEEKENEINKSIPKTAIGHIGYQQVRELILNLLTELITLNK